MSPAHQRFFSLPELVIMVAPHLDKDDVSRLMRTCRQMHTAFKPWLFTRLELRYRPLRHNLFSSTETTLLFSRSIQDLRELEMHWPELAFYHNCILFNERFYIRDDDDDDRSAPSRPWWVSPLEPSYLAHTSYQATTTHVRPTQVCWIHHLNSQLVDLTLIDLAFQVKEDGELFALSINNLTHLTQLDLRLFIGTIDPFLLESTIFFCMLPSLQKLKFSTAYTSSDEDSSFINSEFDAESIAKAIVRNCGAIRHLAFDSLGCEVNDQFPFAIMEALPEQQVEGFYCYDSDFILDKQLASTAILKHSSTLRTLVLQDCFCLDSKAFQLILVNLEVGHYHELDELYQTLHKNLQLTVIVEFPWACTKVRSLALAIDIPELSGPGNSNKNIPYYRRQSPITLSEEDRQMFALLERLSIQIGKLTELGVLDLHTIRGSEFVPQTANRLARTYGRFPAMLSLGDKSAGRPGYLDYLQGLKQLWVLRGSLYADTDETRETTGQLEAAWMQENWPALEQAEFFPKGARPTPPFLWLMNQRKKQGVQLRLSYP
ncbi:hypothetical protein BGX23_009185 [Mortierella sp. AD031]|nr:hypothetical protein BGX23_009185 [Mortierella sp. AD031]